MCVCVRGRVYEVGDALCGGVRVHTLRFTPRAASRTHTHKQKVEKMDFLTVCVCVRDWWRGVCDEREGPLLFFLAYKELPVRPKTATEQTPGKQLATTATATGILKIQQQMP